MSHSGKFIACFIVLVIAIAITEVRGKTYYTHEGLREKAMTVCCGSAVGKRDFEKVEKEDASAFLISPREKRGISDLRTKCCHAAGCTKEDVLETSLREECIDEGCYYEEIEEVCK